ncbi:MAG: hypothetical protein KAT77_06110 [Nanoarchaeota archaeon]|nr:hypothetical protein [Nanoarchaeota archaeon]
MDFCVKCGKKNVYDESLCKECYEHEYLKEKKKKKKVRKELAKHPLYFEAILQLRNPDKKVLRLVDEAIESKEMGVAKVEKVTNGYDFYLADQKFAQQVGKKLRSKFGGVVKVTAKLFSVSRQTGKEVYRVTVLYRKPSFKVGDVIVIKGEKVKIKSMAKDIVGVLESGRKVKYRFKELERLKII